MFGKVIGRRLIFSAFILIAVSLLVFGATLLLPGDAARAILGQQATPERIAALNEQLGLNQPAWQRYFSWLGGLFVGDFGTSTASGGSVAQLLSERIGNSFILMAAAAIISVPLGIGLGVYSALHRGGRRDSALTGISLVFAAMPEFVIGIGLIAIFATSVFQILPAVTLAPPGEPARGRPEQLILPTLTLILLVTPYIVSAMMPDADDQVLGFRFRGMAGLKGVPVRNPSHLGDMACADPHVAAVARSW